MISRIRTEGHVHHPLLVCATTHLSHCAIRRFSVRTLNRIDLFGLIRHTLVTWSEMGKQTPWSIERHIEYHISIPRIARMVHYCKVFDCNNNSTDERLSFHNFPDDPKLQKVGITFVLKSFKS